jgi:riboflavin kinase/FMN adenylyltransferase
MKIISGTTEFRIPEETVVSIGKFDGVHKGHMYILKRMREYIRRGYKLCILTFDIPPSNLGFGSDKGVFFTNTEKRMIFSELEIDYYIEFPFYEKTASIPAQQFIEEYIVDRMNAKAVVVGEDCTFGQGAAGNGQMLRDFGPIYDYEVEIITRIKDGKKDISSTYLKELLEKGKTKKIRDLTFHPYFVKGRFRRDPVGVGTSLWYYVMDIPEEKVMPLGGVYYARALYEDESYPAMTNVCTEDRTLETYIYGGVRGIVRNEVAIELLEWKREEIKFYKASDLNRKIKEDIFEGQKWHKENSVYKRKTLW